VLARQRREAFADPAREHDDQHLLGPHQPRLYGGAAAAQTSTFARRCRV
jgi:hypothetical protein